MATISAAFINPFLVAAVRRLEDICSCRMTVGQMSAEVEDEKKRTFVTFGVHGDISAKVVFAFDEQASGIIIKKMLAGYSCDLEDEELIESTLCEMCNVIIGNAAVLLENNNINIMISTPVLTSEFMHEISADAGFKVIKVPLMSEIGEVLVAYCFR